MIFIDTNAWIALADANDKFHNRATSWFAGDSKEQFTTSSLVILETLGWLRYKRGKKLAVEVGKNIYFGSDIRIERVMESDESDAWKLFEKLDGRSISMIDCTSMVLMKRLKIKEIFTFDRDFSQFGFKVYPA